MCSVKALFSATPVADGQEGRRRQPNTTIWASPNVFIRNTWSSGSGTRVLKIDGCMPLLRETDVPSWNWEPSAHSTVALCMRIGGKDVQR